MTLEERAHLANEEAREAQLTAGPRTLASWDTLAEAVVLNHLRAAILEEREACAAICDSAGIYFRTLADLASEVSPEALILNAARTIAEEFAAAIRARR